MECGTSGVIAYQDILQTCWIPVQFKLRFKILAGKTIFPKGGESPQRDERQKTRALSWISGKRAGVFMRMPERGHLRETTHERRFKENLAGRITPQKMELTWISEKRAGVFMRMPESGHLRETTAWSTSMSSSLDLICVCMCDGIVREFSVNHMNKRTERHFLCSFPFYCPTRSHFKPRRSMPQV